MTDMIRPFLVNESATQARFLRRVEQSASEDGFDESWLQMLIHQNPEALPLQQIDQALGCAVPVCVELPLSSGFLDNLLFTASGIPILVEVKLWRNPEARRKVVAQALDYAGAVFRMSYEELEAAISRAHRSGQDPAFKDLYNLVTSKSDTPTGEAEFIDAVSRNLQAGRGVVIVAGDGIREEVRQLSDLLQSHPALRFTFALAEFHVFEMGDDANRMVLSTVPIKTELIERGVLRIVTEPAGAVSISTEPANRPAASASQRTTSITEDEFMAALKDKYPASADALAEFLPLLAQIGIQPKMQKAMNLKFQVPSGNDYNLATIRRNGQVDTDPASLSGREDSGHEYDLTLAALIRDGKAHTRQDGNNEQGLRVEGGKTKMPCLSDLLPQHAEAWSAAMKAYIDDRLQKDSEG
ncbi:MAG: hypothetical protein GDA52_08855 [Rhodobacteraceae bacterium]|nr:hypothetical protein [Paracoccaceae bacterium]